MGIKVIDHLQTNDKKHYVNGATFLAEEDIFGRAKDPIQSLEEHHV